MRSMKLNKKFLFLILLIAAMAIIFFPVKREPDLDGYWTINKITINGKVKYLNSIAFFFRDSLHIYEEGNLFKGVEKAKIKFMTDTLILQSGPTSIYTGTYKINLSKSIADEGDKSVFDVELVLAAKDKTIRMSRVQAVNWYKGTNRGRP